MGVPTEITMFNEDSLNVCQGYAESREDSTKRHVCGKKGKHKYKIPFRFKDPFGGLDGLQMRGPISMVDSLGNTLGDCTFSAVKNDKRHREDGNMDEN